MTWPSPSRLWHSGNPKHLLVLVLTGRQELTLAPSPRADGSRGEQAATASGTSDAKESHGFGETTQFSAALLRV